MIPYRISLFAVGTLDSLCCVAHAASLSGLATDARNEMQRRKKTLWCVICADILRIKLRNVLSWEAIVKLLVYSNPCHVADETPTSYAEIG